MGKNKRNGDAAYDSIYSEHLDGKNGARQRRNSAADREMQIEFMYQRVLTEMSVNRFKWTGIDDDENVGIDVRFMELMIQQFGLAVVIKHFATGKIIALQGAPSGQLNWAQNPTSFNVFGNLFGSKVVSAKNCVPIWANYLRLPDTDIIKIYAKRLAQADRTLEINAVSARKPKVIIANENQRLSMVNINRQIDEGQSLIQVNADMYDMNTLQASLFSADLGVHPDTLVKHHEFRTRLWGEAMGLLGFDFANQDKKERQVVAEVDANNSQVDGMRMVNLNARKQACELINKKWGTKLDVEYHVTTETSAALPPQPPTATVGMGQ